MKLATLQFQKILSHPSKLEISIGLLFIMYLVGFIGISLDVRFAQLTPLNLVLSFFILLINHEKWNYLLGLALGSAFSVGLLVEWLGVQQGLIFGSYEYGNALGWTIGGVPLLIGWNWMMLTYVAVSVMNLSFPKASIGFKTLIGGFTLVGLDFLIEPLSHQLDFWYWEDKIIPFSNYRDWFWVSFILIFLYYQLIPNVKNKSAIALLILQLAFFGGLQLIV